jgi:hypothetical protein
MRLPQSGLVQVGFEEIAVGLPQARLWIASVLPTTQQQLVNERIALFARMSTGRSRKMPMT